MSEARETRQRLETFQRTKIWNEINMCGEYEIRTNNNNENEGNQEIANTDEVEVRENVVRKVRNSRRQR